MSNEKLKNYNQKLLALLGTIMTLIAFAVLILVIIMGVSEIKWMLDSGDDEPGILSEERIEELQEENKRLQVVSYDFPSLVDTLNLKYLIPVKHKTLNAAEFIDPDIYGLFDMAGYPQGKIDRRYSSSIYGSFNNLLIYDQKNKTISKLFDKRVNFGEINTNYINEDIIVLMKASSEDTFRDGVINLRDMKSLYLYSFSEGELRNISIEGLDVQYFNFVENTTDLLIQFGIDHNKDGRYDEAYEPSVIKLYNFDNDKLIDVIDKNTSNDLQKLLEGTED
ncbi:MAG: hypothetical protein ED557_08550 [Balneola sp.]|nr:MAG: hypothetical protein ED557_08550 [Balneola sp.]